MFLGDNLLDSCAQFKVKDSGNKYYLKVKFYSKDLDVIAREGSHNVSTRFNWIVGSKRQLGALEKRFRETCYVGLTRCEVSLYFNNTTYCSSYGALNNKNFPETISGVLDKIVSKVLNHEETRPLVLHCLSMPTLIQNFCKASSSALIIGPNHCWIVNAVTSSQNHSVGTKRAIRILPNCQDLTKWSQLE